MIFPGKSSCSWCIRVCHSPSCPGCQPQPESHWTGCALIGHSQAGSTGRCHIAAASRCWFLSIRHRLEEFHLWQRAGTIRTNQTAFPSVSDADLNFVHFCLRLSSLIYNEWKAQCLAHVRLTLCTENVFNLSGMTVFHNSSYELNWLQARDCLALVNKPLHYAWKLNMIYMFECHLTDTDRSETESVGGQQDYYCQIQIWRHVKWKQTVLPKTECFIVGFQRSSCNTSIHSLFKVPNFPLCIALCDKSIFSTETVVIIASFKVSSHCYCVFNAV